MFNVLKTQKYRIRIEIRSLDERDQNSRALRRKYYADADTNEHDYNQRRSQQEKYRGARAARIQININNFSSLSIQFFLKLQCKR